MSIGVSDGFAGRVRAVAADCTETDTGADVDGLETCTPAAWE